jgi:hypothetical protein
MMMPSMASTNPIQYPRPISPRMPVPVGPQGPLGGQWGGQPPPINPVGRPMPVGPARPVLGQFHKGGKVGKTGAYMLKKGEHVIAKGKRKMVNHEPQKMVSIAALRA